MRPGGEQLLVCVLEGHAGTLWANPEPREAGGACPQSPCLAGLSFEKLRYVSSVWPCLYYFTFVLTFGWSSPETHQELFFGQCSSVFINNKFDFCKTVLESSSQGASEGVIILPDLRKHCGNGTTFSQNCPFSVLRTTAPSLPARRGVCPGVCPVPGGPSKTQLHLGQRSMTLILIKINLLKVCKDHFKG